VSSRFGYQVVNVSQRPPGAPTAASAAQATGVPAMFLRGESNSTPRTPTFPLHRASLALRCAGLGTQSSSPKSATPPGLSAESWRYGAGRE
jgi:hypothetical protein